MLRQIATAIALMIAPAVHAADAPDRTPHHLTAMVSHIQGDYVTVTTAKGDSHTLRMARGMPVRVRSAKVIADLVPGIAVSCLAVTPPGRDQMALQIMMSPLQAVVPDPGIVPPGLEAAIINGIVTAADPESEMTWLTVRDREGAQHRLLVSAASRISGEATGTAAMLVPGVRLAIEATGAEGAGWTARNVSILQ